MCREWCGVRKVFRMGEMSVMSEVSVMGARGVVVWCSVCDVRGVFLFFYFLSLFSLGNGEVSIKLCLCVRLMKKGGERWGKRARLGGGS